MNFRDKQGKSGETDPSRVGPVPAAENAAVNADGEKTISVGALRAWNRQRQTTIQESSKQLAADPPTLETDDALAVELGEEAALLEGRWQEAEQLDEFIRHFESTT